MPALPLDGGRVLRALLWAGKHDFAAATRIAAEVSRLLAFLLIGLGLLLFVTQGSFSGAWLAFIGWFLLQAAASEARYPLIREALTGLTVRNLMVADPVTAEARETLAEFMQDAPGAARFAAYPVLDDGRVVGMLPFSRVMHLPHEDCGTRVVRDSMLPLEEVTMVDPDEAALEAFCALSADGLHRGLVVKDGHLVGLLSISDFARVLQLKPRA